MTKLGSKLGSGIGLTRRLMRADHECELEPGIQRDPLDDNQPFQDGVKRCHERQLLVEEDGKCLALG